MRRKPKDRDYLETLEGMFFCVVDYIHPPRMYTAYLKYVPSKRGSWGRGAKRYERSMNYYHVEKVSESISFLEEEYPQYVHYCPVRSIKISMVPEEYVEKYYRPEERLVELLYSKSLDELEERVVKLVDELASGSGLKLDSFGVTGSILLKIHNPKISDVDLTIYGLRESLKLKEWMRSEGFKKELRRLPDEFMLNWASSRAKHFPLTVKELYKLIYEKWNVGLFMDKFFSIHPIRRDEEIEEEYGDYKYRFAGKVRVKALIEDSSQSIFLPAIYKVSEFEVLDGVRVDDLREVVSFEGLYCDLVEDDEWIEVSGKLERVEGKGGEWYRVVVGSFETGSIEYVKPLKWIQG